MTLACKSNMKFLQLVLGAQFCWEEQQIQFSQKTSWQQSGFPMSISAARVMVLVPRAMRFEGPGATLGSMSALAANGTPPQTDAMPRGKVRGFHVSLLWCLVQGLKLI